METKTEFITPQIAAKYLESSCGNRPLRKLWVEELSSMMIRGEFFHTHQGIAFNDDGALKDGHHRLHAIVTSGVGQSMQVTRGLTKEAHLVTDWMRARSLTDAMSIDGDEWVDSRTASVARLWMYLMQGNVPDARNKMCVRQFMRDHRETLEWARKRSGSNIYSHSCILVIMALARDAGHESEAEAWHDVLCSGVGSETWHVSAIRLRDWWMRNHTGGGTLARVALCHRVYSSLRAWIERRPLTKIYEAPKIDWLSESTR